MARYVVEFRRGAEKDLRRLDAVVQKRVLRAADNLATDPRPTGCRETARKRQRLSGAAGSLPYCVHD